MNNRDEIRFRDILYSLKKRIKVIILTSVIGLVIGAGVWGYNYYLSLQSENCRISASIAVTSQTDDGLFTYENMNPTKSDVDLAEEMVDSVIYVCQSRRVLNEAVKRNELLGISAADIYNNIFFTQYNKTQIIEISLYWPDEAEGIQILTSITEIVPDVLMETLKIGNVSVINDPVAFANPKVPDYRMILSGLLIGLLVGVGYVVIRHNISPTLIRVNDVKECLGVSALGQIPEDKDYERRVSAGSVDLEADKKSIFRENFSTLAHILLSRTESERPFAMFVTSSAEGEGKSTVTANLGWELSRIGKRVLIIDFDLVRPVLASFFGIRPDYEHSLNAVYYDDTPAEDAMTSVGSNLYLLPAKIDSKSIVFDGNMERILSNLKERFDIVLIDTTPLCQTADAFRFASVADYALFVAAFDDLNIEVINDNLDMLKKTKVDIVGCVLNRMPVSFFRRMSGAYIYRKGSRYRASGQTGNVGEGDAFETEMDRRMNELKGKDKK